MSNPLSEEQIKRINEITQLPAEQQQIELNEFLKTLNPEQIEFLKAQQSGGQCPFCLMADGKIATNKVYEDNYMLGVLDINPATKGHVILFPKKHCKTLSEIKDVSNLFNTANNISNALLKNGAEGTNIFVANGEKAGQMGPHVLIHIIPRYSGDGLNFNWNPMKFSEEELRTVAMNIKKNIVDADEGMDAAEEQMKKIIYKQKEKIA